MKTKHNYEYRRTHKSMQIAHCLYLLFCIYSIVAVTGFYYDELIDEKYPNCNDPFVKLYCIVSIFDSEMFTLLMSYAILVIKSTDDILQGINKLDYLIKVSVFQRYKNKRLELIRC